MFEIEITVHDLRGNFGMHGRRVIVDDEVWWIGVNLAVTKRNNPKEFAFWENFYIRANSHHNVV